MGGLGVIQICIIFGKVMPVFKSVCCRYSAFVSRSISRVSALFSNMVVQGQRWILLMVLKSISTTSRFSNSGRKSVCSCQVQVHASKLMFRNSGANLGISSTGIKCMSMTSTFLHGEESIECFHCLQTFRILCRSKKSINKKTDLIKSGCSRTGDGATTRRFIVHNRFVYSTDAEANGSRSVDLGLRQGHRLAASLC